MKYREIISRHSIALTIAKENQNDKIERIDHSFAIRSSLREYSIVHDFIPIFTCENLMIEEVLCCSLVNHHLTWKTVINAVANLLKFCNGVPSGKLNLFDKKNAWVSNEFLGTYSPPNNCMPSRANMRMNKNRRNSKLTIDRILLNNETTRLRRDAQCLEQKDNQLRPLKPAK